MSDMISRVSAAIHLCADDADASDLAIAAIKAMREPTEEMATAGGGKKNEWDVHHDVRLKRAEAICTYTKMIDAALGDT
jgi:hypothetical protein